jgi:hypothetical protein
MTRSFALLLTFSLAHVAPLSAQDEPSARPRRSTNGPWFGLTPPTGPGTEPAVIVGQRAPHPVTLPPGEPASPELTGAAIRADLERIVAFSNESRATKEVGADSCGAAFQVCHQARKPSTGSPTVQEGWDRRRARAVDDHGSASVLLAAAVLGSEGVW